MTEAKWIKHWLKEKFKKDAIYVPNGLNQDIFFQTNPLEPKTKKLRVLLEGPISVPFKGMADAFEVVGELDCEVWCVSSSGVPKQEWKCDRFFNKIPMDYMKKIYSSCDILLKMSKVEGFFGPPLEMMACGGTVVVGKVTGYDEYIIDGYNGLVVEEGDILSAQNAIINFQENRELLNKLKINGKKTSIEWNWERSIDILEKFFYG
jgi:glycosyltransferase involved in cell wall biosynthesis